MTKQTIKNALEKIGVTDGQKQAEFFAAFAGKDLAVISDNDVCAVLNKLGVTDKKTQGDFFAAVREPEIMEQELDFDELDAVAGGNSCDPDDADRNNCVQQRHRILHIFNNEKGKWDKDCAATVETEHYCSDLDIDSTCTTNDGCEVNAVIYVRNISEIYLYYS